MIEFSQGPHLWQTIASVLIFAAAYMLILTEIWNRSYIAVAGSALMLILGVVPFQLAFTDYINWNTLFLIVGQYITTNFFRKTGVFPYLAARLIRRTSAKPLSLLLVLAVLSGVGSALFDGLLVIIVLVPFTLNAARMLKVPAIPLVIAEILMANLGGTATLIGNTPNRLIGTYANFSFLHVLTVLGPLVLVLMIVILAVLAQVYKKEFLITEERKKEALSIQPSDYLLDLPLLQRGGIVALLMMLAFILHGLLGIQTGLIAIIGALLICIVDFKHINLLVKQKDYIRLWQGIIDSQILFFIGLFIMVGGLIYSGVSGYAAARWVEMTQGSLPFTAMLLLWLTGIGSAAVDSIPYIAAMLPVVKQTVPLLDLSDTRMMEVLWWALAIGAGIGGGGSLVGSTLNMVAAGLAEEEGVRLTHWRYFKVAGLLTLLMMVLATIYLLYGIAYF